MAEPEDFIRQTQEGLKYLLRKRKPKLQEMEEAVGGGEEVTPLPPTKPEQKEIEDRGRGGSRPWSGRELRRGYRKP